MESLTRVQFAEAVRAAISGVEHLYQEVDLLLARLRENLAREPEPLRLKGSLAKASRADSRRVIVRYEFLALFEAAPDDAQADDFDADDDDDEDEGDSIDDDRSSPKKRAARRNLEVAANQPLLAVRLAMFDPRRGDDFEPQVQFAVMNGWSVGGDSSLVDDRFAIPNTYMLRRVARELADRVGVPAGTRIQTKATARRLRKVRGDGKRLSCVLSHGVEIVPLCSINSAQALDDMAQRMKSAWLAVVEGSPQAT